MDRRLAMRRVRSGTRVTRAPERTGRHISALLLGHSSHK